MKKNIIPCLLMILLACSSCNSSKLKKEAESITKEFFNALKEKNENKMQIIYPEIKNLSAYFKSDSIRINGTSIIDSLIIVSVHNRFLNGFGKIFEQDISLYFKKQQSGKLSLFDSKGLTDFTDEDEYLFALNTGCIDKNIDTTDQNIAKKLEQSQVVMVDQAIDIYKELKNDIRVTEWNWETGYSGYASGRGIMYNGSSFTIPQLKYKVTYFDSQGNQITSDDGYVSYEPLDPGESRSFTVYTSYVGSASRARVEPIFDEHMIFKYLSKKSWTGNECAEYYKSHSK